MIESAREFLGSGIAFPFRVSGSGLPELDFVSGEALVDGVVRLLLQTAPGDLPWDPGIGASPDELLHGPLDADSEDRIRERVAAALDDGDPRLLDVEARIRRFPSQERADVAVRYRLPAEASRELGVRLPRREHQDILRQLVDDRVPIQGRFRSVTIVPGFGGTGNE